MRARTYIKLLIRRDRLRVHADEQLRAGVSSAWQSVGASGGGGERTGAGRRCEGAGLRAAFPVLLGSFTKFYLEVLLGSFTWKFYLEVLRMKRVAV